MKSVSMYAHAGSYNHGCEAIVRSTIKILKLKPIIYSNDKKSDKNFNLDEDAILRAKSFFYPKTAKYYYFGIMRKCFNNWKPQLRYQYPDLLQTKGNVVMSIGGDNYCYSYPTELIQLNKYLSSKNKTVLWGCSITPERLSNSKIIEDMNRYTLITPRESITYEALIKAGVQSTIKLFPDPAFILETVELDLPKNFLPNKTIGVNVSPLIQGLDSGNNITYRNYSNLVKYILKNTDYNVALIPHVIKEGNNDLDPLSQLYKEYNGSNRIVLIEEHNCMELKGFISRCRMFIGARTHATIAAYSTCVPTLVVGYSVKAKGIAKDIFGTYKNYVLPVQALEHEDDLTNAFIWLSEHEDEIGTHLQNFMPSYIQRAWQAGDEVRKLLD